MGIPHPMGEVNTMGRTTRVRTHKRKKQGGGYTTVRSHRRRVLGQGSRPTPGAKTKRGDDQANLSSYALFDSYNFNEHYAFGGVSPETAEALMTGWPNISPDDTQNDSPPASEMVALAKKHNGTLCGYVIPAVSGRDDARIMLDGFTVKASNREAQRIYKEFESRVDTGIVHWKDSAGVPRSERWYSSETPDEFEEVKPGIWRFWWD